MRLHIYNDQHNTRKPLKTQAMLLLCLSRFPKSLVENFALNPLASLQNCFTVGGKAKISNLVRLSSTWQIKKGSSIFRTWGLIFSISYQFPPSLSPIIHTKAITNWLSFTKNARFNHHVCCRWNNYVLHLTEVNHTVIGQMRNFQSKILTSTLLYIRCLCFETSFKVSALLFTSHEVLTVHLLSQAKGIC